MKTYPGCFVEKLGSPFYEDIEDLGREARAQLRQKFMSSGMGVSGANFLVAETGTVTLVTNEGNGRMCTSMPRVHVAIAGMEKVVPSIEDLGLFLRLLIRSATGQMLSSYVTTVTGPRRDEDEDGPGGVPPCDSGQRPLAPSRGRELARGALLSALRSVSQCLPHIQEGGRSRLRLGVPGPHRSGRVSHADRPVGRERPSIRLHPVRGV